MQKKMFSARLLAELGIGVALATVLGFIKIYQMPQGGSVSLEMVPLFWIAVRWGLIPGVFGGAVYGLVQLLLGAFIVHPIQLLLDYPVAFAFLGLAGLFATQLERLNSGSRAWSAYLLGAVLIGGLGRFFSHFWSGVIFFGQYAPEGQPVWLYSLVYNLTYILPEALLSFVVLYFLGRSLDDIQKVPRDRGHSS